ncbi:hypothetical protein ABB37_03793 [Leptomonas pyrrhocoris]|uniref:Uncharacterized protein n=1 Tax=Leptomonas pyrrhocoris TaxID=157538 RepID=A0A0M9G3D6_LEPPY|nr:hypothetical protein ABB37_03793 [Leptomonas pyrrhocoris]KPA81423.1 hypothetical protein ABB37_03793 [Leptomonas pyrrhocoris]|eukprot:XP_015659862.1 hypothetical protein ABB37_03793 [Leptomonas pyrrhocoris]
MDFAQRKGSQREAREVKRDENNANETWGSVLTPPYTRALGLLAGKQKVKVVSSLLPRKALSFLLARHFFFRFSSVILINV